MRELDALREIIEDAERVVFFGGAGMSTESGIPDFRGTGGLYTQGGEDDISPETIISGEYLMRYPDAFYGYYKRKMLYPDARPNEGHYALAELERRGKLSCVITQNIDGLHQAAGSRRVLELHGSVNHNYCLHCGRTYPLSTILEAARAPYCPVCGGLIRPDVVLFGEGLNTELFTEAEEASYEADVLIVGGTSLTVHPACTLVDCFEGEHLVIINRTPTPYDALASHVLRTPLGETLASLCDL